MSVLSFTQYSIPVFIKNLALAHPTPHRCGLRSTINLIKRLKLNTTTIEIVYYVDFDF
jgi:hypothetical protein